MASVLPFIRENLEYIETVMDSLGQDEQNECLLKAKNDILAKITEETNCTRDAATQITKSIHGSPFRAAERNEIGRLAHSKVSAAAGTGNPAAAEKGRQALQSCSYIHRYIPAKVWVQIQDQNVPMQRKIAATLDFAFGELGLSNANETTLLNLLASVLLANYRHPDTAWQINQADTYTLLQELKFMVKALRSRGRLPHHGKVLHYPATVADFQKLFPDVFEVAYPVRFYGAEAIND